MKRCFLKALIGDASNAILAVAGLNLRKLLRGFVFALIFWLSKRVGRHIGGDNQRKHALATV